MIVAEKTFRRTGGVHGSLGRWSEYIRGVSGNFRWCPIRHYVEHLVCTGCDRVIWIAIRGCPSGGRDFPRSADGCSGVADGCSIRHLIEHLVCRFLGNGSDLGSGADRVDPGRGFWAGLMDWAPEIGLDPIYFLFIFILIKLLHFN